MALFFPTPFHHINRGNFFFVFDAILFQKTKETGGMGEEQCLTHPIPNRTQKNLLNVRSKGCYLNCN